MANNTEILLDTIPQLFELCNTIRQAAEHVVKEPASASVMKADITAGIAAVEAAAGRLCPETPPASTKLDDIPTMEGEQLFRFVTDWFTNTMGAYLVNQFRQYLQAEQQFTQESAEKIARWIMEDMPIQASGKRELLLELGMRCAAWAPEFSWRLMSQVMDTMPPEDQKKIFPHWSGALYRPGVHPQTKLTCCPICGGVGIPYHAALSGRMVNFNSLFLPVKLWMRCQECENLYTRYFPTEFLQLGKAPKILQPAPNRMVIRQVQKDALHIWCNILNKIRAYTNGMDLLEVGVGQGHLIAVAQEMGYHVTAVELIESDAQETADLLGISVICGDFLHLNEQEKVDIITMGDVIEHLQYPVEGLKKAHAMLKENGILWLSTPNFESSFTRLMKAFDPMWCEPYHITYFSYKGLMSILKKVGFELLEYAVSNRYNGSMELLLRKVRL